MARVNINFEAIQRHRSASYLGEGPDDFEANFVCCIGCLRKKKKKPNEGKQK